jgi:hypothetical protein
MKSLQPERDGLVNRYNPETKAFELTEPPAPVVEQPIRPQLPTQSNWMVEIAKRPAKIITEGTSFCNYVCANAALLIWPSWRRWPSSSPAATLRAGRARKSLHELAR